MPAHDWDQHYASGELPWDTDVPDRHLVDLVEKEVIAPGRALDVGCGTGTHAIWLAKHGFEVHGVDVSPLAIEQAGSKGKAADASVAWSVLDFLHDAPPEGSFDLVFDRGVLHVFDGADERALFARRVAAVLAPAGRWLSLAGSTEGPPRDHGPPRRSALDLVTAVEPVLEIESLLSSTLDPDSESGPRSWVMLSRPRREPAQPSTGS